MADFIYCPRCRHLLPAGTGDYPPCGAKRPTGRKSSVRQRVLKAEESTLRRRARKARESTSQSQAAKPRRARPRAVIVVIVLVLLAIWFIAMIVVMQSGQW